MFWKDINVRCVCVYVCMCLCHCVLCKDRERHKSEINAFSYELFIHIFGMANLIAMQMQ